MINKYKVYKNGRLVEASIKKARGFREDLLKYIEDRRIDKVEVAFDGGGFKIYDWEGIKELRKNPNAVFAISEEEKSYVIGQPKKKKKIAIELSVKKEQKVGDKRSLQQWIAEEEEKLVDNCDEVVL